VPVYTQGGGHQRTVVYGKIRLPGAPVPTYADADVKIVTEFTGSVTSFATEPATTWHFWLKWMTNAGVLSELPSGGTSGHVATTGQDVAKLLEALTGELTESQLYSDLTSRINLIDDPATGLVKKTDDLIDIYGNTASAAASALAAAQAEADAIIAQGIAEDNADIATTQAGLATTAKNAANTSATNASQSASAAATSATNAAGSASTATTQAGLATTAKNAAATSETNASQSAGAAAASATNAAGSVSTATTQANLATTAKDAAATSATNASQSASAAATSATNAAGSASTATTQAGLATTAKNAAATSATNASQSASAAATSATNAAGSASTATTQASIATNAKNDATGAATSAGVFATNSATSATNAATSAASAASSLQQVQSAVRASSFSLPLEQWVLNGQTIVDITDGKVGTKALRLSGPGDYPNQGNYVAIDPTKKYRVKFWARPSSTTTGTLYFSLRQFIDEGTTPGPVNGGRSPYKPAGVSRTQHNTTYGTGQWGEYNYVWDASNWQTGVKFVQPEFLDNYSNQSTGYWDIQAFSFTEVTQTEDLTAVVQTLAETTAGPDGATAQYTVKTDVNGYVAGFGLSNTVNTAGVGTSEFTIVADKFAIAPVNTSNTAADGSPFFHRTAPTTINGVVIPAGTYMKSAFIHDATITSAKIANLAVDNAKIANLAVTSLKIADLAVNSAKISNLIQSDNFNGTANSTTGVISNNGTTGWAISKLGNAVFNNIRVRGDITGSTGTFSGTVAAGNVTGALMRATTVTPSYGGWRFALSNAQVTFVTPGVTYWTFNGTGNRRWVHVGGFVIPGPEGTVPHKIAVVFTAQATTTGDTRSMDLELLASVRTTMDFNSGNWIHYGEQLGYSGTSGPFNNSVTISGASGNTFSTDKIVDIFVSANNCDSILGQYSGLLWGVR
jgi:hypothetical protein